MTRWPPSAAECRAWPSRRQYRFEGPDGSASLLDLFDGSPPADRLPLLLRARRCRAGPERGCRRLLLPRRPGLPPRSSQRARHDARVRLTRALSRTSSAGRRGMGWEHPLVHAWTDDFDADFGVAEWHGTNAFIRDGNGTSLRTYFVDSRGDEAMGSTWKDLDLTALGRQEEWEDSPEGYPQTAPLPVVEPPRRVRRGLRARLEAGQLARAREDGVDHRLGQLAGEGVLLARVEAAEQDGRPPAARLGAVAEPRLGPGRAAEPGAARRPRRTRRGTRRPARGEQLQLLAGVGQAVVALGSGVRLVRGRRAADGRGDERAGQPQPVVAADRRRLVGEARSGAASANSQSPERSPVNTRPVRLPPWAAGARPRT